MNTSNKTNKSSTYTAISIIIIGIIISLSVLIPSGALKAAYKGFKNIFPKAVKYQSIANLEASSLEAAAKAQPKISYNGDAKYLFVETSDLDCINCARFHGYSTDTTQKDSKSSYEKILDSYVKTGDMDYLWIDSQGLGDIAKHNAVYCAGEQDPKKFFEFKDYFYKNFDSKFDLEAAKNQANSLKLNIAQYEDCFNSQKYSARIQQLTGLSASLGTTGTPTFYIYEVSNQEVDKVDGGKETKKTYKLLDKIIGNSNYDAVFKPKLNQYINQ